MEHDFFLKKNFIIIKETDDASKLQQKLNSANDYVVLKQNDKILVQRIDKVRDLFEKASGKPFFHKLVKNVMVEATVHSFFKMTDLPQQKAYAFVSGNKLKAVSLGTSNKIPNLGELFNFEEAARTRTKYAGPKPGNQSQLNKPAHSANPTNPRKPSKSSDVKSSKKGDEGKKPYYLNADYPKTAQVKEMVKIKMTISNAPETEASLPAMVKEGVQVDLRLNIVSGFHPKSDMAGFVIPGGNENEAICVFEVEPSAVGKGEISVYAFQERQLIGNITFTIEIKEKITKTSKVKDSSKLESPRTTIPDLSFLITEHKTLAGEKGINFLITAGNAELNIFAKQYGPVVLRSDPAQYFSDLFNEIEGFNDGVFENKTMTIDQMERLGTALYERLIPDELKQLLWAIRDKLKTIMINSTEPFIPWEICRMYGTENGRKKEVGFLCELYQITRWIPSHNSPQPLLRLSKCAMVVPENSGLRYAKEELKFLKRLSGKNSSFERIPANYSDVKRNLASGEFSLWHFTGHGSTQGNADPNKSVMYLDNDEKFLPDYISGEVENLGIAKPIVFLNACQLGRSGISLTGVGGWAPQFLKARASVFIGTYWSVLDDSAYEFAKEFYNSLIRKKKTIGEAAFAARQKIKANGDPAWLAYTVYADPYAKIS